MAKRGNYSGLRFCPYCGVDGLEFDRYREVKNCPKPEYICPTCGFGFRIGPSARVELASRLHREERSRRAPVDFKTACVGEEIANAYFRSREDEYDTISS